MAQERTKRVTTYKNADKKPTAELLPKTPNQKKLIDAITQHDQVIVLGPAGTGKTYIPATFASNLYTVKAIDKIVITRPNVAAGKSIGYFPGPQPLYSEVLTPTGWTTMGALVKGAFVVGSDGTGKEVLEVFDKGQKEVFEVETSDGRRVHCCNDHLWFTKTKEELKRNKSGGVRTLGEIRNSLLDPQGKPNHYLPSVSPIEFESGVELPIPPYTLGALLGDGSFGDVISLANQDCDNDIRDRVALELSEAFGLRMVRDANSICYRFTKDYPSNKKSDVDKKDTGRWTNPLKQAVDSLNLLSIKGPNKFIPAEYLFAPIEDRTSLLKGLMDTDGSVKKNGECVFHTSSLTLARNVQHLVRSLGGNSSIRFRGIRPSSTLDGRVVKSKHDAYDVSVKLLGINPFHLSRKASRWKTTFLHHQRIVSVKHVGYEDCRCILVDSNDHLYVTSDFVLTHNTLEEKMMPWVMPVLEVLHWNLGKGTVETGIKNGNIEIAPFETMRGRSFQDAFVILDEAQNVTVHEIKMFLTRIGQNCKVILNGDIQQSDLSETSGLSKAIHLAKKHHIPVPVIEFDFDDIVRSELCKQWIKAFTKENL